MSNINPQSIDGTYPIAGQDNNSQGFRDNFTNTVNNFTFAAAELNDLQQNAVLKAALGSVGQSGTPTNDLNYSYITHAQMIGTVETKKDFGNILVGGSIPVDWAQGHFQTVDLVGANATVSFGTTWPATNLYTRLRLQCNTYGVSCNLALPAAVSTNISSIQGASGQTINLPAGGVYVFEFSTWNNGTTIAIQDVLRNYDIVANGASSIFTSVTTATLVTTGAVVNTGVQLYVPTANTQTFTGNVSSNKIIIAPKPSLGAGSYQLVTLPNVTTDGTTFSISANVTTYVGTFSPWVSTTVDSGVNVAVTGGTSIDFIYSSSQSKWFKV
jgi:hypothetical protein